MVGADPRFGDFRSIARTHGEHGGSDTATQQHPIGLGFLVLDGGQVLGQISGNAGRLRRKQFDERIARGPADRGINRDRAFPSAHPGIAFIPAHGRIHRIEHGNVNNGQGAGRTAWPELLPGIGMVIAAGISGDLVPAMERIEALAGSGFGFGRGRN